MKLMISKTGNLCLIYKKKKPPMKILHQTVAPACHKGEN